MSLRPSYAPAFRAVVIVALASACSRDASRREPRSDEEPLASRPRPTGLALELECPEEVYLNFSGPDEFACGVVLTNHTESPVFLNRQVVMMPEGYGRQETPDTLQVRVVGPNGPLTEHFCPMMEIEAPENDLGALAAGASIKSGFFLAPCAWAFVPGAEHRISVTYVATPPPPEARTLSGAQVWDKDVLSNEVVVRVHSKNDAAL